MNPQEYKIWQLGKAQGKDDAFIKGAILASRQRGKQEQPETSFFDKAYNVAQKLPGAKLGEGVGTSLAATYKYLTGKPEEARSIMDTQITPGQALGSSISAATLPASLALNPAGTFLRSAAQFAGLSGAGALGKSLTEQDSLPETASNVGKAAVVGGVLGGVFNLLGKGISYAAKKIGSPALSFTSGVPKAAIDASAASPKIAKQGLSMSVNEVRNKAVTSLQTLQRDLSKEFASGLDDVVRTTGQTKTGMVYNQGGFLKSAPGIKDNLTEYSRRFAREFRLGTQKTPQGMLIDFSKSPIVKAGERANVQEAFNTISNWDDFTVKGTQDLAERLGALRNFESGVKTESSAILGKIYNKVTGQKGIIGTFYPELQKLRTNFSQNKKVLDEISSVLNSTKKGPMAVQSSVTRLDNLFRENRDVYVNAIKQLSQRSGVDYISLLAGGEFQKILPNFIRGLGGGGAVAVGASVLNPWLAILAPLFSPRFAGVVSRSVPRAARAASPIVRSVTTQSIPQILRSSLPRQ